MAWFRRKSRRKSQPDPTAGMTRDQIRAWYGAQAADYDIVIRFNDDDTIRSIDGWRKGEHRPWRSQAAAKDVQR